MTVKQPDPMLRSVPRLAYAGGLLVAIASIAPAPAHAQAIDYGALEQLFGEPVTTSVTGSPQRVSDVPATTEIVTAEDIRRSGATDIPGVLLHVAGIDVLQWSKDGADVSTRGYDQAYSPRMLVLIDGRQVYADYYGFTPWSTLPVELSAIRQIEIVKGPNSALFGFNAAGGVINIITYNPLFDNVNTASVGGGTQKEGEGSAVGTYQFGSTAAVRLTAGGRSNADFDTPIPRAMNGGDRPGDNRGAIDFNGQLRLSDRAVVGFEASHTEVDQNEVYPGYDYVYSRYGTDSVKGDFSADTSFGLIQATAYTNWINNRLTIGNGSAAGVMTNIDNQVTVAQLQDIFSPWADHSFRLSVEYRHNEVNTTPVAGAHVSYDVFAASGMWEWRITPDLSLTNAFRLDDLNLGRSGFVPANYPVSNSDWDRTLIEPSFNSGLVWKATGVDTLRLTASRGVQLPNLIDFGALLYTSPFLALTGVPTLEPTVVTNYELAWDRDLRPLAARFRASVFDQHTDGVVSQTGGVLLGTNGEPYLTPENVGTSDAQGVELELKGRFAVGWRWGASYRLEAITDHFIPGATDGHDLIDYQHTTPVNSVKANLGWSDDKWEIDGYLQYQSATYGLVPGGLGTVLSRIPEYVSMDGRVAYKLTDWSTLALSGQGITQANQTQTSGPAVQRRVLATLTVRY
jgi:iron complex outermembrane receptor protein